MSAAGLTVIGDLLVDTNLLLVLVVGLVARDHVATFKRTRGAYTVDDFDLLRSVLARAKRVVVTPHIMTEVSNLAGHLQPHLRRAAFELLAELAPVFEEHTGPTAELVTEPLFIRLGLTDAAIARSARGNLTVLTDDLDLYVALSRVGAQVYNFTHVRSGAWGAA